MTFVKSNLVNGQPKIKMEQEYLLSNTNYCRLCSEENKHGINLFKEDENSEDLATLINRYLPIKIDHDDPYPKSICPGCHIQLEAAKLFMDLIIEGQAKLRDLLKAQRALFDREEKERKKLQEALKNHNPNASVETYTIQTDESGEKFIIQIYSEGPLFLPEHELALKAEGLDRPKRKRGRPPKVATSPEQPDQAPVEVIMKEENMSEKIPENSIEDENIGTTDSNRRKRRTIKAPARYEGVVQGKELDKILKKEGVIDEEVDDLGEEEKNNSMDKQQKDDEAKMPIGIVVTTDGGSEKPVYINRRPPRIRKYSSRKQKQKYTCNICKKEFMHVGRYEIHKRSHRVKYACQGCQIQNENQNIVLQHQKETEHVGVSRIEQIEEFNGTVVLPDSDTTSNSMPELIESMPEVSEEKPIKCPICEKSFACKQNYEVHLKAVHDGVKPFKCDGCERSFAYACSLKCHMISHKSKENGQIEEFSCDKCDKVFHHPSSLMYHKDTEHGNQTFICNKCNKSFKHRQLLQRHQTVHTEERPFQCAECAQSFKTRTNLINHENAHKGLKKYTCAVCGQGFMHKTSLAVHTRWHEGNKPYECDVCKKAFSQKGNLIEHKRIHTGEKPYTCDLCGRSFTTSSQWKLHSKRHTGEKPFCCEYCQKRFLHKDTFDTHIRRHLDIRPYKCMYCDKKFSESWACSRHQRIHLGQKPYHCDICNKSFADASNFNKHTKVHLKNGIKPGSLKRETRVDNDLQFKPPSLGVQIIIPSEAEATTPKNSETEDNSSSLEFQELLDADGNIISLTTSEGQPIPIVSSGNEKIQGLMPDGTLVSFDLLPAERNEEQQNEPEQEGANERMSLINTEIQFLEENSISNPIAEKPAFLSEDGKVCFITTFDENSFLTMS